MVVEPATLLLDRMPRACGFLLGTVVMAVALIVSLVPLVSDHYHEATADFPAMLVIAAVGYVAAIAATIGRPTRVGQGILVGLTAVFPAAFAGLVAANLGIIG